MVDWQGKDPNHRRNGGDRLHGDDGRVDGRVGGMVDDRINGRVDGRFNDDDRVDS